MFVLWLVLGAATEQRRPEVALAQLRGRGRRSARRLLLRELLPVVLAGLPLGAAAALGLSWLARHAALPGRAPFEVTRAFWLALGAALLVLLVVCVVAVVRVTREPVDALLRRVAARRSGWGFTTGETLLLAVSGTAAAAFVTGGLSGPLAVAAPTLLALVVGLVLSHVTVTGRGAARPPPPRPGSTTAAVGVLEAARSPATRRVVAILTVASALLAFSVDAVTIGARNRTYAAQQEAGAPLVAEVVGSDLPTVRRVLDRIDPAGRTVTPVVDVRSPAEQTLGTLAVVPRAFSRIALWPATDSPGIAWRRLAAPTTPPIRLTGDTIRLDAAGQSLASVAPGGRASPLWLDLDLIDSTGRPARTTAGRLSERSDAARSLVATLPCRSGCLLVGLTVRTLPSSVASGAVRIDHVRTSVGRAAATDVAIGPASQWQPLPRRRAAPGLQLAGQPHGRRPDRRPGDHDHQPGLDPEHDPSPRGRSAAGRHPPGVRPAGARRRGPVGATRRPAPPGAGLRTEHRPGEPRRAAARCPSSTRTTGSASGSPTTTRTALLRVRSALHRAGVELVAGTDHAGRPAAGVRRVHRRLEPRSSALLRRVRPAC